MNGLETMVADGMTTHTRLRAGTRLLLVLAALVLSTVSVAARSDAAGPAAQGGAADPSGAPDSGVLGGPASPSLKRGDSIPPRPTRPAPSVTPSEKILADSVVSFPVDI